MMTTMTIMRMLTMMTLKWQVVPAGASAEVVSSDLEYAVLRLESLTSPPPCLLLILCSSPCADRGVCQPRVDIR